MSKEQSKKERKEEARRIRAEAQRAARRRQQYQRLGYAAAAVAAVAVVIVVMVTLGGSSGTPSEAGSVRVSGPARSEMLAAGEAVPDFSAPALIGGGRVEWADYAGSKTVVSVWAAWCPHCQVELPILERVVAEYADVKLVTIVTSIGDQPGPSPEEYMTDNELTFPVAVDDSDKTLAQAFGINQFPTLYFVNSDGTVASAQTGEVPEADLRSLIESLT